MTTATLASPCGNEPLPDLTPQDDQERVLDPQDERRAGGNCLPLAGSILLIATWLGLVTGLVDAAYWLFRQQVLGYLVFMHPHYLWMAPAAQLAMFLVVGAVLALITGALARNSTAKDLLSAAATLLFMLAWLNVLALAIGGLNFWSWLLFAAGLAVTCGRLFRKHLDRCLRFVRQSTKWIVFAVVGIAIAQEALPQFQEGAKRSALPTSPTAAPNVLLVVLDTVRADALQLKSADGVELTPNLNRLAKRGVTFSQAWTTAPWTLPSHAGMFTGRLPHEVSADWMTRLNADHPTLAEKLAIRGWRTGGFVANTRYCSAETGLGRGFAHYDGYRHSPANFAFCTALGRKFYCSALPQRFGLYDIPGRKSAPDVSNAFLSWLDEGDDRPYFAFLNFWDAHDPYLVPPESPFYTPYTTEEKTLLRQWWSMPKDNVTPQQLAFLRAAYERCLRELDRQVGTLLDELERRGQLANTLIIVTSDHGEHFGDHELYLHGNSLYEPLLHVPLLIVWPHHVPAAQRIEAPVSLQSLAATVLELVGEPPSLPGRSLARHWRRDPNGPPSAERIVAEIATQAGVPPCHGRSPIAAGPMQCARIGDVKYILNGDWTQEFYNLADDPTESYNLADDPIKRAKALALFAD